MATATLKLRPLTPRDMRGIFGVSHMTLLNWRNPPATAQKPMIPHEIMDNGRVHYPPKKVKAWATKNGVEMMYDPEKIAAGPEIKPKAEKKAPAKKKVKKVVAKSKSRARKAKAH